MFSFLQKLGRSLMLPVATLPAAALLLRFGSIDYVKDFHMGKIGEFINQYFAPFLKVSGDTILQNLPIIFAVAIAIGLVGDAVAALAAVIAYLILLQVLATIPQAFQFVQNQEKLDMGVLGGILAGSLSAWMYKRYHNIKLPDWLGFFGGKRFVPIITSITMIFVALIFGLLWSPIQAGIDQFGNWLVGQQELGSAGFLFSNRLLIPTGLHHILNNIFWFQIGTYTDASGMVVRGDIQRFFAGDPTAGLFMTGFFPIMMFALPGAALAFIHTAKPANRKAIAAMFLGTGFASFLTGITEPIEFSFMFAAPFLYGIHAVLTGLSGIVTAWFGIKAGFGFSAGCIDYILNYPLATKPLLLLPIGLIYFVVYYSLFRFLIIKLDLQTPGREIEPEDLKGQSLLSVHPRVPEAQMRTNHLTPELSKAAKVIEYIGGYENIMRNEACITRLRLHLKDIQLVNEPGLKKLGAAGVIYLSSGNVQLIFGTQSEMLKDEIEKLRANKEEE